MDYYALKEQIKADLKHELWMQKSSITLWIFMSTMISTTILWATIMAMSK